MHEKTWIDISVPLKSSMVVWPGDPEVKVQQTATIASGAGVNISVFSMGVHTGTHIDAPLHFIEGGRSVDEMPISATVGEVRVIAIDDHKSIKVEALQDLNLRQNERILFKTHNSERELWQREQFVEDFVFISPQAAQYLAECGISTVGVDYLSVGGFNQEVALVHHILLAANIWIIEGLNLQNVEPGLYELVCLPLKILNSDGAPARAILRKI